MLSTAFALHWFLSVPLRGHTLIAVLADHKQCFLPSLSWPDEGVCLVLANQTKGCCRVSAAQTEMSAQSWLTARRFLPTLTGWRKLHTGQGNVQLQSSALMFCVKWYCWHLWANHAYLNVPALYSPSTSASLIGICIVHTEWRGSTRVYRLTPPPFHPPTTSRTTAGPLSVPLLHMTRVNCREFTSHFRHLQQETLVSLSLSLSQLCYSVFITLNTLLHS